MSLLSNHRIIANIKLACIDITGVSGNEKMVVKEIIEVPFTISEWFSI